MSYIHRYTVVTGKMKGFVNFDVLLTVHLSLILETDQLNAPILDL